MFIDSLLLLRIVNFFLMKIDWLITYSNSGKLLLLLLLLLMLLFIVINVIIIIIIIIILLLLYYYYYIIFIIIIEKIENKLITFKKSATIHIIIYRKKRFTYIITKSHDYIIINTNKVKLCRSITKWDIKTKE